MTNIVNEININQVPRPSDTYVGYFFYSTKEEDFDSLLLKFIQDPSSFIKCENVSLLEYVFKNPGLDIRVFNYFMLFNLSFNFITLYLKIHPIAVNNIENLYIQLQITEEDSIILEKIDKYDKFESHLQLNEFPHSLVFPHNRNIDAKEVNNSLYNYVQEYNKYTTNVLNITPRAVVFRENYSKFYMNNNFTTHIIERPNSIDLSAVILSWESSSYFDSDIDTSISPKFYAYNNLKECIGYLFIYTSLDNSKILIINYAQNSKTISTYTNLDNLIVFDDNLTWFKYYTNLYYRTDYNTLSFYKINENDIYPDGDIDHYLISDTIPNLYDTSDIEYIFDDYDLYYLSYLDTGGSLFYNSNFIGTFFQSLTPKTDSWIAHRGFFTHAQRYGNLISTIVMNRSLLNYMKLFYNNNNLFYLNNGIYNEDAQVLFNKSPIQSPYFHSITTPPNYTRLYGHNEYLFFIDGNIITNYHLFTGVTTTYTITDPFSILKGIGVLFDGTDIKYFNYITGDRF